MEKELSKTRIFNYRPLVLLAVAFIVGIVIGEALYGEHTAFIAIPIFFGVAGTVALGVWKKGRKFMLIPLAALVGFAAITSSNAVYDSRMLYRDEPHSSQEISARVVSEIVVSDGMTKFYVDDIYADGVKLKYRGEVVLFYEIEPRFAAGDVLSISGSIQGTPHVKFGMDHASAIAGGNGYIILPNKFYKAADGSVGFPENVQLKIKSLFGEYLDADSAAICTALMLGDKRAMDVILKQSVSASGLSHVLAVSGLHITTLTTVLYFVLKKLKVKPVISLVAVTVLSFFYTLICSFSASALRAFIMSGVFNAASTFGKKRDNLSTLALAATAILIFRPTALLEIGFLLSFSAMLGIFLFCKSFTDVGMKAVDRISPKRHIGKRVVGLVSMSLSALAMYYPFEAYFFGELPIFMLLSNIIFIPYMMIVYVAELALALFSLITTLHGAIYPLEILIFPFKSYCNFVGGLPFNAIPLHKPLAIGIALYLLTAIFLSRFNLMPRSDKLRGGLIMSAAALAVCAVAACV